MSNNKYRGINEIKVKLLPEKNKRDYILRLVSSIIVFVFIILNFFIVFLPSRNLTADINALSRDLNKLQNQYQMVYDQIFKIDKNLFNIKKNNEVVIIESKNIDYEQIIRDLSYNNTVNLDKNVLPFHSYIENVSFNEATSTYQIYVQFDTLAYLREYENNLQDTNKLSYVLSVQVDKPQNIEVDGRDRVATYFNVQVDLELAPKVGDVNE